MLRIDFSELRFLVSDDPPRMRPMQRALPLCFDARETSNAAGCSDLLKTPHLTAKIARRFGVVISSSLLIGKGHAFA